MSHAPVIGYRKRPWELTLLAVAFVLVPLFSWVAWYLPYALAGRPESLFEVLVRYFGTGSNGPIGLAHALLMGALWVLFVVVGWGIFRVQRWGFRLCILSAVANSLFSMVLYSVGQSDTGMVEYLKFNPLQEGVLVNLVFFVPVLVLLQQKLMAPFFNPRMKWWEQHPRVKALLRIEATIAGEKKTYQSFDISQSGMFLGTGEVPPLTIGDSFPAVIHLEELGTELDLECKVVWISSGQGKNPVGCGVTFTYPKKSQKKTLPRYIQSKIKEGHLLERT